MVHTLIQMLTHWLSTHFELRSHSPNGTYNTLALSDATSAHHLWGLRQYVSRTSAKLSLWGHVASQINYCPRSREAALPLDFVQAFSAHEYYAPNLWEIKARLQTSQANGTCMHLAGGSTCHL